MRRSIAQDWAHEAAKKQAHLTEKTIPEEYKRHARVFSEIESLRFPPKCEEDMTIPLKEGSPDVINCKVYPLTREERGLRKIPSQGIGARKDQRRTLALYLACVLHQ